MWRDPLILRRWSNITFWSSFGLVPIAVFVLDRVASLNSVGHGGATVGLVGLAFCGICWLLLFASVCLGVAAFAGSQKLSITTVMAVLFFIPSTMLMLWGLQG
jgi:hypothetical protein